ncbi:MAG: thioredoxin family protein [Pseudomonadota bacterium]
MKRAVSIAFALAVGLAAGAAQGAEAYTKQAFMAAQQAGKPILVHVTAPWCPTCRAQKPVVAMIEKDNPALMVYEVDFDSQKDALQAFNVTQQSTLIAFAGKAETGRSTGVTDPVRIRELAGKATMAGAMMDKKM